MKNDFEMAEQHFNQGNYKMAQVYFENLLQEDPSSEYAADAIYYLIRIYSQQDDFINFVSYATNFLINYHFDLRTQKIYNFLVNRLAEKEAFSFAYDYIRKYDYLFLNSAILEKVGYGLFKQGNFMQADSILTMCPQSDTIKILRVQMQPSRKVRINMLKGFGSVKGKIYLAEEYLLEGDTLSAYDEYLTISEKEVDDGMLYRFAKIALLFEKTKVNRLTKRLSRINDFTDKAQLLEALATGQIDTQPVPLDKEEKELWVKICGLGVIPNGPPEGFRYDSLFKDSATIFDNISEIPSSYYVDSVYSQHLIAVGQIEEASDMMSGYLDFYNVRSYARRIRALKYFTEGAYPLAMNDLIMADDQSPETMYMLAECLRNMGKPNAALYVSVMKATDDSVFYFKALKGFIESSFDSGNYKKIIDYALDDFAQDTTLIKIYLRSLARMGNKQKGDSIFQQFFTDPDYDLINDYGEFLIEKKEYQKAEDYYSFHIRTAYDLPEKLYYNWALIPFLQGNIDSALVRFNYYIEAFKDAGNYHNAVFKMGTIKYLQEDYLAAGNYYGLASQESTLRYDGLENQLICYKKAETWDKVIEIGTQMLALSAEDKISDIQFELGYAYLRNGHVNKAITHLNIAVRQKSVPEYLYWLGEAYFAKGDWAKALYQYQKIVDQYPKEVMWFPTAQFKTGIVLELMEEFDAAKQIYKELIKKRGVNDTWGIEAQKRLEEFE